MQFSDVQSKGIPDFLIEYFKAKNITTLNPAQLKAIDAGLLEGKSILACTPTGSGKTAIALLAMAKNLVEHQNSKAVYLVPLKALASEKFRDFTKLFEGTKYQAGISTGDLDSSSGYLQKYDVLILTVEKMDSLLRHHCPWVQQIKTLVVDEVHLLNDAGRGPTLEVLITLLKELNKKFQLIALSATIGNPEELAGWLKAELVIDDWRPVKLHKGIYFGDGVEFYGKTKK
ncbi:DEAD/DEAH box helicase [Candidatus Woesearchaeota archaeon]|nr:DEAD/DEAH box helicase [Candidatus Woesearchaeota archaeon]